MALTQRIGFIGGGNMTEALATGLLRAGLAEPGQLVASDFQAERRTLLRDRYKIRTVERNVEAAKNRQIVILSVEPQVLDDVLCEIKQALSPHTLVISVAAGYPLSRVVAQLRRPKLRAIRAMPNTPSSVLEGVTAVAMGAHATQEDRQTATRIFESIGRVTVLDERLLDVVTGLSGSGPAYVYLMVEALADGGVKMGLPRPVAQLLATQTAFGAARMLLDSGEHPAQLKDRVASPGGTTIAGLHQLEAGRLRAALISAVEAATRRSAALGDDTSGATGNKKRKKRRG
jgi:pyrroline-5-carboxylate reductase